MILEFPFKSKPKTTITSQSATLWQVVKVLTRERVGRFLNRLGAPGAVSDGKVRDEVTGQEIEIRVNALFTRISINGRDHYFRRFSGKYDGSGSGCR